MKNPKEKSEELIGKFWNNITLPGQYTMSLNNAKDCAVIVCEEIINETRNEYSNDENHVRIEYWNEVKNQIIK